MKYIAYKDNLLYCENIQLNELVEEYDTPLYVYSKNQILENYRSINEAIGDINHLVCYALKANANHYILKMLAEEGAGADVVSAGELYLALKAGFSPNKIVFAGVGKREDEIEYAVMQNIFSFNVESVTELQMISRCAIRLNKKVRVSLRINPNVDAGSHPYITTGLNSSKFGIEASKALEVYQYASTLPNIEIIGIHTHIGSQVLKISAFVETAKLIVDIVEKLKEVGIHLTHIDFGGGFPVQYINVVTHEALPKEENLNANVPAPIEILNEVLPILKNSNCSILLEPGRSIVANAGILITKVINIKENFSKKFVVVDGAMTDLIRPSLYQAYHQIVPLFIHTFEQEKVDVVGPVCESSDYFARDRILPKVDIGEYLAILTAGAYGFVLSSNYNGRLRPAEVLVNNDKVRLIRARQKFEDLD